MSETFRLIDIAGHLDFTPRIEDRREFYLQEIAVAEQATPSEIQPLRLVIDANEVDAVASLRASGVILLRCGAELYAAFYADWLATEHDPRFILEHVRSLGPLNGEMLVLGKPWGKLLWSGNPDRRVLAIEAAR